MKRRRNSKVIDQNDVDFAPLGLAILKLEHGLDKAKDASVTMQQMKHILTTPVMELKANAAIFHYTLIGNLANIMLSFLEAIVVMDKDAIDIVKAHHDTLHMIIVRGMKGDGGDGGKQLTRNCSRRATVITTKNSQNSTDISAGCKIKRN